MSHHARRLLAPVFLLASFGATGRAQQPTSAQPAPAVSALPIPAVGEMAPDFAIRGATRYGLLQPTRLADYRGQTVVLALFVMARTRG